MPYFKWSITLKNCFLGNRLVGWLGWLFSPSGYLFTTNLSGKITIP